MQWNWMCMWFLGLIHSDRAACHMQFSAKFRRLEFTYVQIQSFSGGRNNLKCCVTELAEPNKITNLCKMAAETFLGRPGRDLTQTFIIFFTLLIIIIIIYWSLFFNVYVFYDPLKTRWLVIKVLFFCVII